MTTAARKPIEDSDESPHPDLANWVLRIRRAEAQAEAHAEGLAAVIGEAIDAGCSWSVVGRALNVSRQAAWERWHAKVRA